MRRTRRTDGRSGRAAPGTRPGRTRPDPGTRPGPARPDPGTRPGRARPDTGTRPGPARPNEDQPLAGLAQITGRWLARGQTVAAFLALKRAGGLLEGPRAELLAGVVSAPDRIGPRDTAALAWLERALRAAVAEGAEAASGPTDVASAVAFRLGPYDLLHADLAVLRQPPGSVGIGGSHDPRAALLVAEVVRGRSSHEKRAPLYAAGGVRELWLLDIERGWTEVLRSPWQGLFRSRTLWYPGETVPLVQLGGVAVESLPRL